MSPTAIALIGARAGSERVPGKNVRRLAGHPLLAYAIETARRSEVFDRIVVSTDSEPIAEVARWYGADVPFLRPDEFATSTSPDIEWIAWTLPQLEERYDLFAIVRATNPFRGPDVIRRGLEQLLATPEADSIRAVERVKQHPGKMWVVDEVARLMRPLLDQSHLDVAWHAGQFQALPPVYVQNSALEIAWTRVVEATGTREGQMLAPFLTEGYEGLNIDDEDDFAQAERLSPTAARASWTSRASRILAAHEARLARDARLRRRLAALALRQGDDRRRARRLVGGDRLARLADGARRRRLGPRAARRRSRPARVRGDPLGPLPPHPPEPGLDRAEGDRRDRERAARPEGEGARRLGRRALRRADARDDPALLVALRHDARAGLGGHRDAEARLVRRGRRARPRGRRARLPRVQDQHRRPRRRASRPDARLRPRRRHRPEPDAGAARRAHAPARGVPRGHGRQGAADRRPQLQPDDGGDRRASRGRSSRTTSPGSRSTRTTPRRSPMRGAARRSRSAPARTSTRCAASVRTSRQARWTSPPST